uniref:Family with sequence similarity 163 member B n=1 Tax=Amphilophus citrinellus TaxID=61819 RepID=A0A3Q0RWN8_AMPCI
MSAGTVVIAGGILATVILLTIVAVLCLCRLQQYSDEPETYPPTFLTEANGPVSYSPPPPPRRCYRSHAFCPSCARCSLPFYLQHPERLCNGGRRISYRTVQQQDMELPMDLASFYQKLNLIRQVTMKEVVTHSVSTDV